MTLVVASAPDETYTQSINKLFIFALKFVKLLLAFLVNVIYLHKLQLSSQNFYSPSRRNVNFFFFLLDENSAAMQKEKDDGNHFPQTSSSSSSASSSSPSSAAAIISSQMKLFIWSLVGIFLYEARILEFIDALFRPKTAGDRKEGSSSPPKTRGDIGPLQTTPESSKDRTCTLSFAAVILKNVISNFEKATTPSFSLNFEQKSFSIKQNLPSIETNSFLDKFACGSIQGISFGRRQNRREENQLTIIR